MIDLFATRHLGIGCLDSGDTAKGSTERSHRQQVAGPRARAVPVRVGGVRRLH